MPILVPAIKTSLFDSIPEIRASAAKALGRLSMGLGTAHSLEMLAWLREHLNLKDSTTQERSGSAQGFAEMISSHGIPYFEEQVKNVLSMINHKEPAIRESYRGVLVFLPTCFDKFPDYLPQLVPVMIQGLADEADEVRKISMRNVKICIKMYSKIHSNQLVQPVMRMMFAENCQVRESSGTLMHIMVKELENDVLKSSPTYIDVDTKQRILASMFICKYDPIEKNSVQAGWYWKSIVDNQIMILRPIVGTLMRLIFQIIQSDKPELQEMGLGCIRGIVEKMGEALVLSCIEIFETLLEQATDITQLVGLCRVIYNMASGASHRLLS